MEKVFGKGKPSAKDDDRRTKRQRCCDYLRKGFRPDEFTFMNPGVLLYACA